MIPMKSHLKVLKNIVLEGNSYRIWQILNKSPIAHLNYKIKSLTAGHSLKHRQDFSENLKLDSREQQILTGILDLGFSRIDQDIIHSELAAADIYFQNLKERAKSEKLNEKFKTKSHWLRLSDLVAEDLKKTENPFMKIALNPTLLKIISKYLGQVPQFEGALLTHSVPTNAPPRSSQLWHQDHDHIKMVKVFVYFSDVLNKHQGPFTFIDAKSSSKVRNSFFPKHLPDSEVFQTIDQKQVREMTGSKLTTFICDTSRCYHMGSRVDEGHERYMLTMLYTAIPSIYPRSQTPEYIVSNELSQIQLMTLNL